MICKKDAILNKTHIHAAKTMAIPIFVVIFTILTFVFKEPLSNVMNIATFLTWHILFELAGIIAYIAIFLVAYYTYDMTHSLQALILGNMLLAAGLIDIFHTFSYKGMPGFFIENTTADRATLFWIAARLISGTAFLISSIIGVEVKSSINKNILLFSAVFLSFSVFIIATWYPGLFPAMYIEGYGITDTKKYLEYLVMLMLLLAAIKYFHKFLNNGSKSSLNICSALLISVISEFEFTIYEDVYSIYNYSGHVLKFISLYMIFESIFVKNIRNPYIELKNAQEELSKYANNLDRMVEQKTRQLKIINVRLIEDLEYAREIQKSMLPTFLPDTPRIGFSAVYLSAERLSGDFYDVLRLDDTHISFYVCDVSGHGVPAAMLTVFLKQCVESIADADRHKGVISSPSCVIQQVYDSFNKSNFKDNVYIVLFYCLYDMTSRTMTCCSGGINEMPLILKKDGNIKEVDIKGFPICKLKDIYSVEYKDTILEIDKGDRLYIYTDGIAEAKNNIAEQYTAERLKRVIKKSRECFLDEQTSVIMEDLMSFTGEKKPEDDMTILAVEIR